MRFLFYAAEALLPKPCMGSPTRSAMGTVVSPSGTNSAVDAETQRTCARRLARRSLRIPAAILNWRGLKGRDGVPEPPFESRPAGSSVAVVDEPNPSALPPAARRGLLWPVARPQH